MLKELISGISNSNIYLKSAIIFIISFLVIRITMSIVERIALRISSKTKTDIDDKLIKKSSIPFTCLAFLISIQITVRNINIIESARELTLNITHSIIVIILAYLVYVTIDLVVIHLIRKTVSRTKTPVDDSVISLFHSVMYIALVAASILYILHLWGFEIGPVLAGLGIAGLAVALALQPVLSNIFSGASIILDKSVRVGDLIDLTSGVKGKVTHVGLRSTKIITPNNELIIVPNSKLAESMIQNLALPEPATRIVVSFSVAYGSNIEKVKRIVLRELNSIDVISKTRSSTIRLFEMGDSGLKFKVFFYLETFEDTARNDAIDMVNTRIYNALNEHGISIPFPQMDVHLKK